MTKPDIIITFVTEFFLCVSVCVLDKERIGTAQTYAQECDSASVVACVCREVRKCWSDLYSYRNQLNLSQGWRCEWVQTSANRLLNTPSRLLFRVG